MIGTADEFVRLRLSEDSEDYRRAAVEDAPLAVWREVIERYPGMREWVAHNKTVPLEILRVLATDPASSVRSSVAAKRKIDVELFQKLSQDPEGEVRVRVANNQSAPRDVLLALASDAEPFVAEAAARRLTGMS